jgi:L-2-hydroxyglutarate oxidase LhgO
MLKTEAVVVGAGVVGLAIARALVLRGLDVLVLEKEANVGFGTSSHNSEVIHPGLYYPPGSLKARLCVEGRRALYQYCEERGVPHKRCGKLVVATNAGEEGYLQRLAQKAAANEVEDLELVGAARLHALEPHLRGTSALFSSCTGIIDSHALMLSLQADTELAGGTFVFRTPVLDGLFTGDTIQLRTGGVEHAELEAELVVNCAGLDAWDFSSRLADLDPRTIPPRYLAKGNYFSLSGKAPFQHLIYPVPEPGGHGIHLTFDLGGHARFGPDVQWTDRIDYDVDPERGRSFYNSIRRYWPDLPKRSLVPAYSGIRPKTTAPGEEPGDFVIQGPKETGHRGYVALYGIESPGLTSCLAIGERVADLALGAGTLQFIRRRIVR